MLSPAVIHLAVTIVFLGIWAFIGKIIVRDL